MESSLELFEKAKSMVLDTDFCFKVAKIIAENGTQYDEQQHREKFFEKRKDTPLDRDQLEFLFELSANRKKETEQRYSPNNIVYAINEIKKMVGTTFENVRISGSQVVIEITIENVSWEMNRVLLPMPKDEMYEAIGPDSEFMLVTENLNELLQMFMFEHATLLEKEEE